MLLLTTTTDKLQLVTDAAATVDVHVSWVDRDTASPNAQAVGRTNTAITTAATTDILAAPASTACRNAKKINVRNKSATTSVNVTVLFNQNATLFELFQSLLLPGEHLTYEEGAGFYPYVATNRGPLANAN